MNPLFDQLQTSGNLSLGNFDSWVFQDTNKWNEAYIDGDMITYEVGFAAESFWKKLHEDQGLEVDPRTVPWDRCQETLDMRLANILARLDLSKEKAIIVFSGSKNFRYDVTTLFKYKENRKDARQPFHKDNIKAYLKSQYTYIEEDGCEADDVLATLLTENPEGILVSRDKDMFQVPGWHYSWELGAQRERLEKVEGFGVLYPPDKGKNLKGTGDLFFGAQLLMGDKTDNIPGIPRMGPKTVYKTLSACTDRKTLVDAIKPHYEAVYGSEWLSYLEQVARCLWLQRKKGELWTLKDFLEMKV